MKRNAPFLVLAIASQACRGETDRSSDGDAPPDGRTTALTGQHAMRFLAGAAMIDAFYDSNLRRRRAACDQRCVAALDGLMARLYVPVCSRQWSESRAWLATRLGTNQFTCEEPE